MSVRRRAFTLIEMLVVIFIVMLVSVIALPTINTSLQNRQVSEAARILQGALVGARDKAIHDNVPCGIRLLPDPNFTGFNPVTGAVDGSYPLAFNRAIPIGEAPEYTEGRATPLTLKNISALGANVSIPAVINGQWPYALIVAESPSNSQGAPNSPTSWFWNIRVGDRIQFNNAGIWYTVVGPMNIGPTGGNNELFVNVGAPSSIGAYSGIVPKINGQPVEYLALVNGQDDNHNGWTDEGWDGVDNDNDGLTDENTCKISPSMGEWEQEQWGGSFIAMSELDMPYTIRRRPAVQAGAREIALPTQMVVDATTWGSTQERSRLPVNIYNGTVDVMVNPDGTAYASLPYGVLSSFGMGSAFYHFWLANRKDLNAMQLKIDTTTGQPAQPPVPVAMAPIAGTARYLPVIKPGGDNALAVAGPYLESDYAIVTLSTKSGRIATTTNAPFFLDSGAGYTNHPIRGDTVKYNPIYPVIQAEQGVNPDQ